MFEGTYLGDFFDKIRGKKQSEEDLEQIAEVHERVSEDEFRNTVKEELAPLLALSNDLHITCGVASKLQEDNEHKKEELDRIINHLTELGDVLKRRFTDEEMLKFLSYENRMLGLKEKINLKNQEQTKLIPKVRSLYVNSINEFPFNDENRTNISVEELKALMDFKQKTVDAYGNCNQEKEQLYHELYKAQKEWMDYMAISLWKQFSASESIKADYDERLKRLESMPLPTADYDNPLTDELAERIMRGERV